MKRRFKSKRYKDWEIAARSALRCQKWAPFGPIPLQITYTLGRPDKRIRDASNYLKAVDDLLVHEGIIADDSWIHRGTFQWGESTTDITVEIVPL
jgi:Holliday junction resolvase RusA-like endonuclease